ncbi:uncharacterized protein EV422DRAFT_528413 [Fimicolochytrium jonesii]|uniref:uncharacterized protein n=1 Tax=Fimicolochytrium jonesii TaxID=1396493 RepID=UPI0022FE7AF1|nr:uncharacterized protein EV422DRAFT_528413 [Fimicolochytrium jonesii]KAI8821521.1 hypothetical protein EV422DRAFT_528413 [Fimicolochytrium jonesii]
MDITTVNRSWSRDLPCELVRHIFSFLSIREQAVASGACRLWKAGFGETDVLSLRVGEKVLSVGAKEVLARFKRVERLELHQDEEFPKHLLEFSNGLARMPSISSFTTETSDNMINILHPDVTPQLRHLSVRESLEAPCEHVYRNTSSVLDVIFRKGLSTIDINVPLLMAAEGWEDLEFDTVPGLQRLTVRSLHSDAMMEMVDGLFGRARFPDLISLTLNGDDAMISVQQMEQIVAACPNLKELSLGGCYIEARTLEDVLTTLPNGMTHMAFTGCEFPLPILRPIFGLLGAEHILRCVLAKHPTLTALEFVHCRFRDSNVVPTLHVPSLAENMLVAPGLTRLVLVGFGGGNYAPTNAVIPLLKSFPLLTALRLDGIVDQEPLMSVTPALAPAAEDDMISTPPASLSSEDIITNFSQLHIHVALTRTSSTDIAASALWSSIAALPNLQELELKFWRGTGAAAVEAEALTQPHVPAAAEPEFGNDAGPVATTTTMGYEPMLIDSGYGTPMEEATTPSFANLTTLRLHNPRSLPRLVTLLRNIPQLSTLALHNLSADQDVVESYRNTPYAATPLQLPRLRTLSIHAHGTDSPTLVAHLTPQIAAASPGLRDLFLNAMQPFLQTVFTQRQTTLSPSHFSSSSNQPHFLTRLPQTHHLRSLTTKGLVVPLASIPRAWQSSLQNLQIALEHLPELGDEGEGTIGAFLDGARRLRTLVVNVTRAFEGDVHLRDAGSSSGMEIDEDLIVSQTIPRPSSSSSSPDAPTLMTHQPASHTLEYLHSRHATLCSRYADRLHARAPWLDTCVVRAADVRKTWVKRWLLERMARGRGARRAG